MVSMGCRADKPPLESLLQKPFQPMPPPTHGCNERAMQKTLPGSLWTIIAQHIQDPGL